MLRATSQVFAALYTSTRASSTASNVALTLVPDSLTLDPPVTITLPEVRLPIRIIATSPGDGAASVMSVIPVPPAMTLRPFVRHAFFPSEPSRQATHSTAGLASLYAADGAAVNDFIYVANERIKIAVENGGNSKTGTFTVIVG